MHGNLTNFHDRKDDCCVRMLWTFPGWFPSTLPRIRGSKAGVEKKLRHLPKNDCQIPKMIQNNSNDQVMKSNMWKLSLEVASSVEWPNQSIQMQILGAFGMQIHHFGMWSMAWPIPSMALIYIYIYMYMCFSYIYIYTLFYLLLLDFYGKHTGKYIPFPWDCCGAAHKHRAQEAVANMPTCSPPCSMWGPTFSGQAAP